MEPIQAIDQAYVASTYARFPVTLVSGKGAELTDSNGKTYIDMGSGIAVNTFGAADPVWLEAVTQQAGKLQHTSNLFYTEPCARLAEELCKRSGMKKVFFSNSGAEANECLIKTARRWAYQKYGDASHATIITLKNSFHGRTVTTLSATGQDVFHTEFDPFTQGFVYTTPNDILELKKQVAEHRCAAILVELVQGEGGVCPLEKDYVAAIQQIAAENELLIAVDEVQTGSGRTGKLFAYQNFDLIPDLVSTAKGLAGGLPLGATLMGERVAETLTTGTHGSTFGGNPVCCAAALSVLTRLDDALFQEVQKKSDYIVNALADVPGIQSVTGMGLMLGITLDRPVKDVLADLREAGVLALSAKQKLRLLPPLNITWPQLEAAVNAIKEVAAK